MKTLSITLSDNAYETVLKYAQDRNRSADDILAEVVEWWHMQQQRPKKSILSLPPLDLGEVRRFDGDDLLEEMLSDSRD